MQLNIQTTTNTGVAAKFLASKILEQLKSGKNVLWFVPGGSAITVAVETARTISKYPHKNLTVIMADERYGPVGHQNSNWQQIQEHGFNLPQSKLIPILTGEDLIATTKNFNTILREELAKANYKIGLFGVGANAHTGGIMPKSDAVNSSDLAHRYKAKQFERITITPKTIIQLDEAVVFMQGKEKWWVLQDLEKDIPVFDEPAQVLKKIPLLTIFTDYKK
ncbi:hypothetical protein A3C67_00220 [Candidatus Nomurabacteria bacterium RIFCSPHIGHO2_02_FULL_42_19]|uniref:Glucosamine/galactosamine-6-phosphate isomerase domain-containing protein n=1 Tax=Candidatus Nomurabacteria bacterium RIFCSPHIGHO2_02_FULL_42_19 TaxID=1801756 RepID=A0A1F6W3A2_9BACT|nr:MAG: hypothetical protein A3C67_00220 [Candidatus Nomurabacteria bacterium RIFCSPHIGHO2_02_FULL_42_19]